MDQNFLLHLSRMTVLLIITKHQMGKKKLIREIQPHLKTTHEFGLSEER